MIKSDFRLKIDNNGKYWSYIKEKKIRQMKKYLKGEDYCLRCSTRSS